MSAAAPLQRKRVDHTNQSALNYRSRIRNNMTISYILDSSVLIRFPGALSKVGALKIVIPKAVLSEIDLISIKKNSRNMAQVIATAIEAGVQIASPKSYRLSNMVKAGQHNLSSIDIEIVEIALDMFVDAPQAPPVVVTDDEELSLVLNELGINTKRGREFIAIIKNSKTNLAVQSSVKQLIDFQIGYLLLSVLVGAFITASGFVVYLNATLLAETSTVWLTIVAVPLIAIILFWIREHFRLTYGFTEFFVGHLMTYLIFYPTFTYSSIGLTECLQILAGLYVIVRGLDNIGKGISGTWFDAYWKKLF